MAARTRAEIITIVDSYTNRASERAVLIDSLCDEALKIAVHKHPFEDATSVAPDIAITEDAVSVDISAITLLVSVLSARIVETSGRYASLVMKSSAWWDKRIVNPSENSKGWPMYGHRDGTNMRLDRPAESDLSLRLRASQEQTFSEDSSECPIAILDTYVTAYVTALVFLSIENQASYIYWRRIALGPDFDRGKLGGLLLSAIMSDKADIAEEYRAERFDSDLVGGRGISVENLIAGHDEYGQVRSWY